MGEIDLSEAGRGDGLLGWRIGDVNGLEGLLAHGIRFEKKDRELTATSF